MTLRFASLGSGSEGNGLVVEARDGAGRPSRVLLDCGFTLKETKRRLARLGLVPEDLDGILVTHEHSDHIQGVARLARRHGLKVWGSHGTLSALPAEERARLATVVCAGDVPFAIGALEIRPYVVPHDAREPTQFTFGDGRVRLGVLTDAGQSTPHIIASLSGCAALVLECNHDAVMLEKGPYQWSLKKRIAGPWGHLANDAAADILAALDTSRLVTIVAAHLSKQNNTPDLARAALAGVLGARPVEVGVADQDDGFDWLNAGA